jgi:hypothetical protein
VEGINQIRKEGKKERNGGNVMLRKEGFLVEFQRAFVQYGSGTHPSSYSFGTGGSYPGGKAAGA